MKELPQRAEILEHRREQALEMVGQRLEMAERAQSRVKAAKGQLVSYAMWAYGALEDYSGYLNEEDVSSLEHRLAALEVYPHG